VTEPIMELREIAGAVAPAPPSFEQYLDKVRSRAYTVTDDDVDALIAAGVSEDEIFEHTVAIAVAEGLRRLDAGLGAIGLAAIG
jgi:alkylhydroperoxidase family enzyme